MRAVPLRLRCAGNQKKKKEESGFCVSGLTGFLDDDTRANRVGGGASLIGYGGSHPRGGASEKRSKDGRRRLKGGTNGAGG